MCVTQQRTIVCTFSYRRQQDTTGKGGSGGSSSTSTNDKNENKHHKKETTKTRMKREKRTERRKNTQSQNSLKAFNIGCYIILYHRALYKNEEEEELSVCNNR